MSMVDRRDDVAAAQDALMRFVRNFGLHQPDRTPCGQPLAVSEAHALTEIARDGELRQVELARRLRLEKSTVSRLVANLVGRGWVRRHTADDDGRGVLLAITDAGGTAATRLADARRARLGEVLDRLPQTERGAVLRALELLAEATT
jgi:DNA-binding MarR family transcriptional regulator